MRLFTRSFLPALFIGTSFVCNAQTFWTEDFGIATTQNGDMGNKANLFPTLNGTWTTSLIEFNGTNANTWFISATELGVGTGNCSMNVIEDTTQTKFFTFDRTLHIGQNIIQIPADLPPDTSLSAKIIKKVDVDASFFSGSGTARTNIRVESPTIDFTDKYDVTVSFDYFYASTQGNNSFQVCWFDGSSWQPLATINPSAAGSCSGQGKWLWNHSAIYTLPASANNKTNIKIGFCWTNDTLGLTEEKSVAVDNIVMVNHPGNQLRDQKANGLTEQIAFSVFPNPNNGVFKMAASGLEDNKEVKVFVRDFLGREVYSSTLSTNSILSKPIDLSLQSSPAAGTYFCTFIYNGKSFFQLMQVSNN